MSVRIVFSTVIFFSSLLSEARAGAPDGQPFAPCAGGDINCVMGGPGFQEDSQHRAVVEEMIKVTLPPNRGVELSLSEALDVIAKLPVPTGERESLFGQARWRTYVKDIAHLLELAAAGGNKALAAPTMTPQQQMAVLKAEMVKTKTWLKVLEQQKKRLARALKSKN